MKLKQILPILDWLPNYQRKNLSGDISAGLTVGVMLIPQGVAYAMIAGLPPVYGLYAAMIPQVVYALFGTSRQLAVGPVAMDSLLVATGVAAFAPIGSEQFIALAILLSLMMGTIQLVFGLLRMGFLVNFLSKPVISGFTSAAAFIIGLNQLKHILGVDLQRNNNIFKILQEVGQQYQFINWYTFTLGIVGILVVKYAKKIHRAIPGALIAVIMGTLTVYISGWNLHGVKIIGKIPEGLPSFAVPEITSTHFTDLIPMAFTLALIAFMEAISVAKALQAKHKNEYKLDYNQEMIGLGMGNIVGSFFSTYPTTGGFGRSAVNDQAGAKTNLAAIISAALIALTLLFLTPLFYYLPQAILGSIILVAVFGLIDFRYPIYLWKIKKEDFFMYITAFTITLSLGIKEGIGAGVLISLLSMIYRSTKPHIAVLGKLPNTTDYRNINRFQKIEQRPDVLVIRHDAQLYFANIENFTDTIKHEIQMRPNIKFFVLHCGSISHIDTTALQALKGLIEDLQKKDIQIAFSGLIGPVRDFLFKSGFLNELGEQHFFIDVQSAVDCFDNCDDLVDKTKFKYAVQTNIFKEKEI